VFPSINSTVTKSIATNVPFSELEGYVGNVISPAVNYLFYIIN